MQWLLIHSIITSLLAILLSWVFYAIYLKSPHLYHARTFYYAYFIAGIAFLTLAVRASVYQIDLTLLTSVLVATAIFSLALLHMGIRQWLRQPTHERRDVLLSLIGALLVGAMIFLPDPLSAAALVFARLLMLGITLSAIFLVITAASNKHYGHYFACLLLLLIPLSIALSLQHAWSSGNESLSLTFMATEGFASSTFAIISYAVYPVVISGTGIFFMMIILIEAVDEMSQRAITDPLTNIYNRRGFIQAAEKILLEARRYHQPTSLIMCDLDHFKVVNDDHGHDAGDQVLRVVATKLNDITRDSDVLARFGGEEFMLLLKNTPESVAFSIAERIRSGFERSVIEVAGKNISFTASFGVVEIYNGQITLDEAITSADKALYRAKNEGRNRVCVFNWRNPGNIVSISSASATN